ncbi:MAG: DUF882 domain-containing protein [Deferrisomatales bacterium]|nr:DUF882 domain-containing protein [Deferrisomatales bacterium]
MDERTLSRRAFCKVLAVAALFPGTVAAAAAPRAGARLGLHNIHTGEDLDLTLRQRGRYDRETLAALNRFFRCHHTGEIADIDPAAVDVLCDLRRSLGFQGRVRIISGYRSPSYNDLLLRRGRRVAKQSLHTQGLAIDFAVPGLSSARVGKAARSLEAGGVGVYRDFVHVDTGRVRHWKG